MNLVQSTPRYRIAPEGLKLVAGGHALRDPRYAWRKECTLEGCQRAGTPRGVRHGLELGSGSGASRHPRLRACATPGRKPAFQFVVTTHLRVSGVFATYEPAFVVLVLV